MVGGWWLVVGGWWLVVGGWWLAGWRLAVGGWRLAVGGWRLVVGVGWGWKVTQTFFGEITGPINDASPPCLTKAVASGTFGSRRPIVVLMHGLRKTFQGREYHVSTFSVVMLAVVLMLLV